MKVAVLGAGVVGVSTAWFLACDGHEVEVIDRASGPARETSFANGGQISVSQSEPWAHPGAPLQILRWLGKEDSPLLFRLRLDPAQWRWIAGFLRECLPGRFERNMRQMLAIGKYSRDTFAELRQTLGLRYDNLERGIVTLIATQKGLDEAADTCRVMAGYGVAKRVVSREELLAIEPALAPIAPRLAGATFCPDDESGDVHQFTARLAEHAAARGVRFRFNTRVNALEAVGGSISGVSVTDADGHYQTVRADAYVLALGSFSPLVAATAGLALPVYPTKGYSATVPVRDTRLAPQVSVTDEDYKIVLTRLGDTLRIAGTAELAGYSSHLNAARCQALIRRARTLLADASADWDAARFWSGLRPSTPGNVPLIGRTRFPNLYLNTGHGTLGFTEGPGSGRALAALIAGHALPFDFGFCA
ncbi:MAG: D-amino acid dehydrogenase [Paludibacterium sp.]|uniref:D-amino acid dehydrogenase n=1 Tax=Paludibacterium sp. TaxID=1917523 RepID=UPI0025EDA180|nr:D-amino acid dehydrogenase [Paludibacterium sp.]MBV8048005.1 D-amino acid dehydrogenase [Paludibacterium sp.]MBV8649173.1 D-amino acid dehydrogenase [Paludibacterium sp.]